MSLPLSKTVGSIGDEIGTALKLQTELQVVEGNMLGFKTSFAELVEHSLCSRIVERVNNDYGFAMTLWMRRQPCGDGVARAFVVRLI